MIHAASLPTLVAACLLAASLAPRSLGASPPLHVDEACVTDVEFLLDRYKKEAPAVLKVKDIDVKALLKEFKPIAEATTSDQEHVDVIAQVVARLRDGHARLQDVKVDMSGFGDGARYACGLELYEFEKKWYVKRATGVADDAAVKAGWQVTSIDGVDADDWMESALALLTKRRGFSTEAAARFACGTWGVVGPEGEAAKFEFKTNKKKKRKVSLTWGPKSGGGRLTGPIKFPNDMEKLGRDIYWKKMSRTVTYVWVGRVPGDLHELFDKAIEGAGKDCETMILDFRSNLGGGYDRDALLGRFVPKNERFGGEESAGPNPFTGNLIVLVDPNTISAGETIVGELKEEGRAYLIGPGTTHGASGSKKVEALPSGLLSVRFVVRSNKQRFNGGEGVEGLGIAPHEIVPYRPKAIANGDDPCIERALELARRGLPKKAVTYVPPSKR